MDSTLSLSSDSYQESYSSGTDGTDSSSSSSNNNNSESDDSGSDNDDEQEKEQERHQKRGSFNLQQQQQQQQQQQEQQIEQPYQVRRLRPSKKEQLQYQHQHQHPRTGHKKKSSGFSGLTLTVRGGTRFLKWQQVKQQPQKQPCPLRQQQRNWHSMPRSVGIGFVARSTQMLHRSLPPPRSSNSNSNPLYAIGEGSGQSWERDGKKGWVNVVAETLQNDLLGKDVNPPDVDASVPVFFLNEDDDTHLITSSSSSSASASMAKETMSEKTPKAAIGNNALQILRETRKNSSSSSSGNEFSGSGGGGDGDDDDDDDDDDDVDGHEDQVGKRGRGAPSGGLLYASANVPPLLPHLAGDVTALRQWCSAASSELRALEMKQRHILLQAKVSCCVCRPIAASLDA